MQLELDLHINFVLDMHIKINMNKAIVICTEMLVDRGYSMNKKSENVFYFNNNNNNIIVFLNILPKLYINAVKECISYLEEEKINHGIIIYNNLITSSANKIINNLFNMTIEIFSIEKLQFNITKHKYYNTHVKLTENEKKKFIEKIGIKIPIIKITDPISKYFNYSKGDVIKILRNDNSISYRLVK